MRTIGVKLTADTTGYISGLARAGAATRDFTGQMDKAAKAGKLDHVADQAARFGIAGVAAFGLVVKSAADFDKQMSAVSAATHASSGDMDKLRAAALQAGKDTQYSATQAAKGITELSKAGVSTADVLGGGLKGALSLAAAGQLDVGEAAETAASAMTQFKLKGDQIPHVADLLAAAAGKAQGSVHDMGAALNQAGLVAAQTGLSIEDTTGSLAAFASAGLTGSDAGTSFKTMLLAIQNPAGKTKELMDELGISAYDAQGNFVGIAKFAGILQEKLKNLTPQMRAQAMAQIFGNDAVRASTILYTQGQAGIQGWIDKTNDAGYAAETAAKLTDNLSGDIERLKGSLETLAIQSGSGANGGLRVLTQGLGGLVNQFLALPPAISSTVTVIAGVGGAAALGLAGFIKLRKGVAEAAEQLNSMGPAGEKAATGLGKAASAAGKAAAAFAVWQAAMATVSAIQGDTAINTEAMSVGLKKFGQDAQLSGEAARVLGGDLGNLTSGFKYLADADNGRRKVVKGLQQALEAVTPGLAGYSKSLTNTQTQVDAIDASLASMVAGGNANQAAATFERLTRVLAVNGVTVEEVRKKFPGYAAAVEQAGTSTKKLSDSLNYVGPPSEAAKAAVDALGSASTKTKTKMQGLTAAANGQRDALLDLSKAMKAEVDPVFGLLTAENSLTAAQKKASAAVKEHGRNSAQAKDATRALTLAAIDLQGKAGALGTTFDGKLTPAMRQTLKAAGLTENQIKDVAKQFRQAKSDADKYDGKYNANVTVTGVSKVKQSLESLLVQQQALKKGISVSAAQSAFNKNAYGDGYGVGHANGGWTGPGSKYQPAGTVHADEYVLQKDARRPLESAKPGALDYMNRTGQWPGYAGGGQVWPFPTTAGMTRIPSKAEAMSVITPAVPSGGQTYKWIEQVVHAAFPGMRVLSDLRPGARTLSGNRSYHAIGRAVDFPPSLPLAEWINLHYKARTKELITPWNDLNIHNGARHAYTGAIFRQHNFAGGNAHDHWAMAHGGVIPEPVYGVGASGRTYSFAENGPERVLPNYASASAGGGGSRGGNTYVINSYPTATAHPADIGRTIIGAIKEYERGSGDRWRN